MASLDRPFSSFVKERRPLTGVLNQLVQPLDNELRQLDSVKAIDQFIADELPSRLPFRPELPEIGGVRPARIDPSEFATLPDGSRIAVARHRIAVEIHGDISFFTCWPSDSADLEPVDAAVWPRTGLTVEDVDPVWELGIVDSDARPTLWALYTNVDLTMDEEREVAAGRIDLVPIVLERVARIEPILKRIRQQITDFFENEIPRSVDDMLAGRREMFANREGVTASLQFPKTWELPAPSLDSAAPTNEPVVPYAPPAELTVEHTPRLSPVTFTRLQQTVRVWADAIERYPRAFHPLLEDQISDLLAATLNATLPGAQREVYSRHGKSDIFVRADVLAEGFGPAKVFIAETKWVSSQKQVQQALDPQLFGYLNASDTAAVLLLLLRQKNRAQAIDTYSQALKEVPGFQHAEVSAVEDWPLYVYQHEGRTLRVCLAWVHIPDDVLSSDS
jgi:hypothetical protein